MNNYYLSLSYGHPGYPGYVRITAPSEDIALRLMAAQNGSHWAGCYETYDELDIGDRIERDYLIFDAMTGDALTWTCHICNQQRLDSKITVEQRRLLDHDDALVYNVRYCNDKPECHGGIDTFIYKKKGALN